VTAHDQLFRRLRAMRPGTAATVWRRPVARLDARDWSLGNGPMSPLVAIDRVSGGWIDDTVFPRRRPPARH
jgi:hypothetical protein